MRLPPLEPVETMGGWSTLQLSTEIFTFQIAYGVFPKFITEWRDVAVVNIAIRHDFECLKPCFSLVCQLRQIRKIQANLGGIFDGLGLQPHKDDLFSPLSPQKGRGDGQH